MKTFGKQLEHHLAKTTSFNLSTVFSYSHGISTFEPQDRIDKYHECGASACVLGHAMVLTNQELSVPQLASMLKLYTDYLHFRTILGFSCYVRAERFWNKHINQVTFAEAADLIRHINTYKAVPCKFSEVKKHYSAFELYKPKNKIYWTASANNITGMGTDEQQAILDYVEQLIAKDELNE